MINFNVLLPPAAKRVGLINFPAPKRSFGRRDSAYCMSVGGSEVLKPLSESDRSLPQGNTAAVSDIRGFLVPANVNGHPIWILHI